MNFHARQHAAPLPPREQTHARRKRDQRAARRAIVHIALPGYEIARDNARPRETISAFLRRTGWAKLDTKYGWQFKSGLPTIVEVNGRPLLRKHWRRHKIALNDNIRFVSRPLGGQRGGGGKQILGLVALVAVAAFAIWAGPAIAGALSLTGTAASVVGGVVTAGIGLAGSLLINSLTAPKQGATNSPNATIDQIYSASVQGNAAKLGQPLPVCYGREKVFPDLAAAPWSEFIGNDQYTNVLLSIGMGRFSFEQAFIDDTPFWDSSTGISPAFPSAQVAFYAPGESVTLFPKNVSSAAEVTGQNLPDPAITPWIGGFIANAAGTLATALAVDFVFPAGCFRVNNQGELQDSTVALNAEFRRVDDSGAPQGPFAPLFSVARTFKSRSPIRDSIKVEVGEGRWEVRFRRGDAPLAGTAGANEVAWAGLRAFLKGDNSFADVSTMAIRIKATESTQGSFRFGVLRTRILPVWHAGSGTFVDQPTRNAGWAFLDAITNQQYGSGFQPSKTDFQTILAFANGCAARGDNFDYTFSAAVGVPEAFDKILSVARARHFFLGDTISVVRDEWRDVPSMLLTDREIVRDSIQVNWTMLGEEDPDAVVLEYIDEETWRPASVQYPPDTFEFTAVNPETKRLDGIVNRQHAFRECAFYYLQSIYRRENVQIGTEYEGRAITFGSAIRVQSDLPMAFGQAGAVVAVTGDILSLDPAPTWATGEQHFVRLRRANGKWFGPVSVSRGVSDARAVVDADDLADVEDQQSITLGEVLSRADGSDYPTFEIGTADNQSRVCVVLSGRPSGNQVSLSLVVDDERVHATDIGDPPVLPSAQFPEDSRAPVIAYLSASFGQNVAEPLLSASWWPAAGAFYYVADVSYDDGASWIQVYEGEDNKFSKIVDRAAIRLRVQGVGVRRGAFSFIDLEAPTIEVAPGVVGLASLVDGIKFQVVELQDRFREELDDIRKHLKIAANQDARNWNDKSQLRSQISARFGTAFAAITEVRDVAVSTSEAFASYQIAINAQIEGISSSVEVSAEAIAQLNGFAASRFAVKLDVNGYQTGFELINGGAGTSASTFVGDKFQIAFPGVAGGAPVDVWTVTNVNGVPKAALRADMIVDGAITAAKILAGEIKAFHIEAFSISTTQLAVNGVTLEKIVAGAATKINSATIAAPVALPPSYSGGTTIDNETTLLSTSFFCAGGSTLLLFSIGFEDKTTAYTAADGFTQIETSPTKSTTVRIFVDGSVQRTFNFINPMGFDRFGTRHPIRRGGALTPALAINLSAGVHSVAITARSEPNFLAVAANDGGNPGPLFSVADFVSFESRR